MKLAPKPPKRQRRHDPEFAAARRERRAAARSAPGSVGAFMWKDEGELPLDAATTEMASEIAQAFAMLNQMYGVHTLEVHDEKGVTTIVIHRDLDDPAPAARPLSDWDPLGRDRRKR